jgi:hypothetical protein
MTTGASTVFVAHLKRLVGKECWGVIAGPGTGSTVHLSFGDRIPRIRPVRNEMLREDERRYEGELDLFIECAWRLERDAGVLCGSGDDGSNDGPMVQGLSHVITRVVTGTEVGEPVPDLIIQFDQGLCLRVFCDQAGATGRDDDYSLRVGDTIYGMSARGVVEVEKRTSD